MKIKEWVLSTQSADTIREIAEHGCINGTCCELIYYSDTIKFYDEHIEEIWKLISDRAEDMGISTLKYISRLLTNIDTDTQFKNALTWMAVENVCLDLISLDEFGIIDLSEEVNLAMSTL